MEFNIICSVGKAVFIFLLTLIGGSQSNLTDNYFVPCAQQEVIGQGGFEVLVSGLLECATVCLHSSGDLFVTSPKAREEGRFSCFVFRKEGNPCGLSRLKRENGDRCYKKIINQTDVQLYKFFEDELVCINPAGRTWEMAKSDCESFNANLITIASQEKQDFIHNWAGELLAADVFPQHQISIGGYWDGSQWMWLSGISIEDQDYQHFTPGDNEEPGSYKCLAVNFDSDSQWIAYSCTFSRSYFCEKTIG